MYRGQEVLGNIKQVEQARKRRRGRAITALFGLGLGAGIMYLFDPERGRGRRAVFKDRSMRVARKSLRTAGSTFRDLTNRLKGAWSRLSTA